jgi:hypothetical protein
MAAICAYISAVWAGAEDPVWPHLVLIPASVLAGIAVGAGIVFEAPKYSPKTHNRAFLAVVLGIAIESLCTVLLFVVDERISNAQQSTIEAQRIKIIALENRLAPRSIDHNERAAISELLRKYEGQEFQGAIASSIADGRSVWEPLHSALLAAHWVFVPPSSMGFGNPPAAVPIAPEPGVVIFVPPESSGQTKDAGIALANALVAIGIDARVIPEALGDSSKAPPMIEISIGIKVR